MITQKASRFVIITLAAVVVLAAQSSVANAATSKKAAVPAWVRTASSTPWKNVDHMFSTNLPSLGQTPSFMVIAANLRNSKINEHQKWSETSLDKFAWLHTSLLTQLRDSMTTIHRTRDLVAQRIEQAAKSGHNVKNARGFLKIADAKILQAKKSILAVSQYVPPVVQTKKKATAASIVKLAEPRKLGAKAVKDVGVARRAVNNTIVMLARSMGLSDFKVNP